MRVSGEAHAQLAREVALTPLQGAAAGPLHPRAGALPLDPEWNACTSEMFSAHASVMPRLVLFPQGITHARPQLFFLPQGMTRLHSSGTGSFAGGVLGELAWVPLIGGAGAKRPAILQRQWLRQCNTDAGRNTPRFRQR